MKKLQEIARFCLDEITNIWHEKPEEHPLSQILSGNPKLASLSKSTLESKLQEIKLNASSIPDIELAMWLRSSSSVRAHLPTWVPLLKTAKAIILARSGQDMVDDCLVGLEA